MRNKAYIIGIAGGSGSGKSTLVKALKKRKYGQDIVSIQHDAYYKDQRNIAFNERENLNYDHPDALDTELLITHLKELKQGNEVEIPEYDSQLILGK
jgi:uridine kinase